MDQGIAPGRGARGEAAEPGALADRELDRIAALLRPLASPVRLRLLRFLTRPHYLEEAAAHVGLTRQATRRHLDQLVDIGVLHRVRGERAIGAITEYIVNPKALFLIQDEMERLGSLRRERPGEDGAPTTALREPAPPAPVAGPGLVVVRGLRSGERLALDRDAPVGWSIGRDPRCSFVVDYDPYASARHAEIRWDAGRFVLTDLRSTNGTRHNLATLPRGGEARLRHGDLVGAGKTLLLFWDRA